MDIDHADYVGIVDPDSAFWSLVQKNKIGDALSASALFEQFHAKRDSFVQEMELLRFGLKPSAVYFNPTERCNLNCSYCYIPEDMRQERNHHVKGGIVAGSWHTQRLLLNNRARGQVTSNNLPRFRTRLLAREAMFAAMEEYADDFAFGVQTNGLLLDDEAITFLTSRNIGIGLSLDGHTEDIAHRTRKGWTETTVFDKVASLASRLRGYPQLQCHLYGYCTQYGASDRHSGFFFTTWKCPLVCSIRCVARDKVLVTLNPKTTLCHVIILQRWTGRMNCISRPGRKLVVANFANVLVSIVAPLARRLMCDISPCGGGQVFLCRRSQRRPVPVQRVCGCAGVSRGQPLPRRHCSRIGNRRVQGALLAEKWRISVLAIAVQCAIFAARHAPRKPMK